MNRRNMGRQLVASWIMTCAFGYVFEKNENLDPYEYWRRSLPQKEIEKASDILSSFKNQSKALFVWPRISRQGCPDEQPGPLGAASYGRSGARTHVGGVVGRFGEIWPKKSSQPEKQSRVFGVLLRSGGGLGSLVWTVSSLFWGVECRASNDCQLPEVLLEI